MSVDAIMELAPLYEAHFEGAWCGGPRQFVAHEAVVASIGTSGSMERIGQTDYGAISIEITQAENIFPVRLAAIAEPGPGRLQTAPAATDETAAGQQPNPRNIARKSRRQPLIASSMRRRPVPAAKTGPSRSKRRSKGAANANRPVSRHRVDKTRATAAKRVRRRIVWLANRTVSRNPATTHGEVARVVGAGPTRAPRPECRAGNTRRGGSTHNVPHVKRRGAN